jgi:integrase
MAKSKNHRWLKVKPNGSLLIRFKYQNQLHQLAPVTRGKYDNPQDLAIANRVASEIEQAVKLGTFTGLDPWKPKSVPDFHKDLTLTEVWQQYKIAKADKVSKASQKSVWVQVDRCLEYVSQKFPLIGKVYWDEVKLPNLIRALENEYSTQVISRALSDLHAACNLALKRGLIEANPLVGYKDYLPDKVKSTRSKECYSQSEVEIILDAFKDSHYANFVEFLFLTGVRPQLAIALTWCDITGDKIIFNKGFTNGEHTEGKTGRVTHYPLYPQLKELITRLDDERQIGGLVFLSPKGNHINLHNFTNRVWKPVITRLVEQGKLSKYLPTYHCRHSTATFLAKAGLPSSTIAALLDTSETMLNRHYLDNQELTNVEIPDLLAR